MQQRYQHLFIVLGLLFLAACRPSPIEEPDIIVQIDPEFRVDLYDERDTLDGHPAFGLWLEGLTPYPCAGFRLDASVLRAHDTLRVLLAGVKAPDSCVGDPAVLRDFVPVGPLADGTYTLELHLGQAIGNSGALLVAGGQYEWLLQGPAGIELQNRVVRRLPEGILWGYVRTAGEQDVAPANALIADLKERSADHGLPPGYYGYFTITGTGLPFFHSSAMPEGNALYFVRRFEAQDLPAIRDLLNGYRNDVQQPVTVDCRSTAGRL